MSTSVFEIVGPIMLGPSSSHTAGMARIGMMAGRIAGFRPKAIDLCLSPTLRTTYRGHRTDAALIGGALGMPEDDAQLRDALEIAKESGVSVTIDFFPVGLYHPNTAQLKMTSESGEVVTVRGVSVGGGSISMDAIDDQELNLIPDQYHLVLWGTPAAGLKEKAEAAGGTVQSSGKITAVSFTREPEQSVLDALRAGEITKSSYVLPVLTYGATISEKLHPTRIEDCVALCQKHNLSLAELAVEYESQRSGFNPKAIRALMLKQLEVMRAASKQGMSGKNKMLYGLTCGEDARKLMSVCESGKTISGGIVPEAVARAIGVMEYNASMGCIVAAPTAGSAGIVPGCMLTLQEKYGFTDDQIIDAMFTSALMGVVMAHRDVSFSGSVGGCQGEVGVSSAIAAAGIATLFSTDPQVPGEAMAMSLKNLLGLVCDPIAGPVEVPCIKRNAVGVANAFIAAEMAVAGITSYICPDEVIDALIDVEHRLPGELRATTVGGLACTKKAVALREKLSKL